MVPGTDQYPACALLSTSRLDSSLCQNSPTGTEEGGDISRNEHISVNLVILEYMRVYSYCGHSQGYPAAWGPQVVGRAGTLGLVCRGTQASALGLVSAPLA